MNTTGPAVTFGEAEAVHRRRYRAMTTVQRLRLADELSKTARMLAHRVAKGKLVSKK